MSNKEKEVWNGIGTKWYLDEDGKPKDKFVDPSASDFEFALIGKPNSVLEIGIGAGRDIKKFISLGAEVSGIDISETFIEMAKKEHEGNFVVGDVRDIIKIFEGNKFDLVYSRWSLIHLSIEEFKTLLNNIHSILSEEGKLLVSLRGGNDYEEVNSKTGIRSLQLNEDKLKELLPNTLMIEETIMKSYESVEKNNDKQFTFVVKKK